MPGWRYPEGDGRHLGAAVAAMFARSERDREGRSARRDLGRGDAAARQGSGRIGLQAMSELWPEDGGPDRLQRLDCFCSSQPCVVESPSSGDVGGQRSPWKTRRSVGESCTGRAGSRGGADGGRCHSTSGAAQSPSLDAAGTGLPRHPSAPRLPAHVRLAGPPRPHTLQALVCLLHRGLDEEVGHPWPPHSRVISVHHAELRRLAFDSALASSATCALVGPAVVDSCARRSALSSGTAMRATSAAEGNEGELSPTQSIESCPHEKAAPPAFPHRHRQCA